MRRPRKSVFCLGTLFVLAIRATVEGTELLDAADIADRGVVFESADLGTGSSLQGCVGVGDVNGDGLGDILLAVEGPGAPDRYAAVLVLGRGGLTGTRAFPGDLQGTVTFRATTAISTYVKLSGPVGDVDGDGLSDFFFSIWSFPGLANEAAGAVSARGQGLDR